MRFRVKSILVLTILCVSVRAWGVILSTTATRNTQPPGTLTSREAWNGPPGAGDPRRLLNSGWQYQGKFGIYLGTPISPNHFITAQHIGGNVGDSFIHQNLAGQSVSFNTNGVMNIAGTDLRVWQIDGTFDHYATMWDETVDGLETGKPLVVFGRGTQRGSEVIVNGVLRGWEWGTWDTVQSWGENVVKDVVFDEDLGGLLQFDFDKNAGPNEGALSAGDSGGGVFIQSDGVWKLAAINLGVSGPWRTHIEGADFHASLFDAGGLYVQGGEPPGWQVVPEGWVGSSYSSRISSNLNAIETALTGAPAVAIPEPAGGLGAILGLLALGRKKKNLSKPGVLG